MAKPIEARTAFGMGMMIVGSVTVYTMKMIFKSVAGYTLPAGVRVWPAKKGVMLRFETTDYTETQRVWQGIGAIAKDIAVRKLSERYAWVNQDTASEIAAESHALEYVDDLPF